VNIICNVRITDINFDSSTISYQDETKASSTLGFKQITLATGAIGASQMLGVDLNLFGFDKPMTHRVVNLLADDLTDSDLCYIYGLDSNVDFYRVTNYRAFSGNDGDKRLTIEVLGDRGLDNSELAKRVMNQLHDVGFVNSNKYSFSEIKTLTAGFPTPTTKNISAMNELAKHLKNILPNSAKLVGIGAENGLFFQNEIIQHISTLNFNI
jgi:oxygen-dependent protoporphyrinogen oxidase